MKAIETTVKKPTNRLNLPPRSKRALRDVESINGFGAANVVSEIFGYSGNFDGSVLYGCKIS